ncbi:LysR substrate-binding domain-containing protein [Rhizobium sp. BK602]|uniref:LysR substrate-binding domain-containing protein n=1 Tax=Rhizobium sp. BK602 TaxID=2586986 RepID=UPI0016146243|nr:LysR substrate-binding domain-containing protein [Rhizobium sp. BK602]MBB3612586.1 DNA-binding transcriptional LysR family regulator [Rhizobium sp. BK602]
MDTRFLRSLIAVVETGSIAGAARREKLTPAAISQRIQALELSLNCSLLSRGAHSVRPTETCLALLPRARLILREADRLGDDIAGGELAGELRIGAISTVLTGLLPSAIRETARLAPQLKLRLVPGASHFLYEQLLAGELDMAILVEPPFALPKSLVGHVLRQEPLLYLTQADVSGAEIARHIADTPFIRYDPTSWGGRLVARYLEASKLSPDIVCDLDALETIAILVSQGLGNALVPSWPGLSADGLTIVPVPAGEDYVRKIVLLHAAVPARPQAVLLMRDVLAGGGKGSFGSA